MRQGQDAPFFADWLLINSAYVLCYISYFVRLAVKDEMKEIIDSIVPPTPELDGPEEASAHEPAAQGIGGAPSPAAASEAAAHERSRLLPRQEAFCRHYVTQPVATRAAALAGYAERSAHNQGHRLLQIAEVLERIAALRAERNLTYALERDTMHDKLEGVFMGALAARNFAPALAAMRLQAQLAGLMPAARTRATASPSAPRRKNDEECPARPRKTMKKARRSRAKMMRKARQ